MSGRTLPRTQLNSNSATENNMKNQPVWGSVAHLPGVSPLFYVPTVLVVSLKAQHSFSCDLLHFLFYVLKCQGFANLLLISMCYFH